VDPPLSMSLVKVLQEPQNRSVCQKLVFASVSLITLPILVFLAFSKGGLAASILGEGSQYELAASAAAAVLVINLILATYVYIAFTEETGEENRKAAKKQ